MRIDIEDAKKMLDSAMQKVTAAKIAAESASSATADLLKELALEEIRLKENWYEFFSARCSSRQHAFEHGSNQNGSV